MVALVGEPAAGQRVPHRILYRIALTSSRFQIA